MLHDELDYFHRLRRWFVLSRFSVIPDYSVVLNIFGKQGVQFLQGYLRSISTNLAGLQHRDFENGG